MKIITNEKIRRISYELEFICGFNDDCVLYANISKNNYLIINGNTIKIGYNTTAWFCRILSLAAKEIHSKNYSKTFSNENYELSMMIDCSRNAVMNVDSVKKLVRIVSLMGYTSIQLYTEDTYEVLNEPYWGYMRGRYSHKEIQDIDKYCSIFDIELIPCIQTLAHLNNIMRWRTYKTINDIDDILLVDDKRTYELIENIFNTLSQNFTSRKVNIGMDEAHNIGRGKYLDKNGYQDVFNIMKKHLSKVVDIATQYGFEPMMWSDMFLRLDNFGEYYANNNSPEISEETLKSVSSKVTLVYWDYYHNNEDEYDIMLSRHEKFINNKIAYAGGAWSWTGFAPHNKISIKRNQAAISSCKKHKIDKYILTAWGNDGGECSVFSMIPTINDFASNVYSDSVKDSEARLSVISMGLNEHLLLLDLPNFINKDEKFTVNPSKYLLYNDCFYGFMDSTLEGGEAAYYRNIRKCLNKYSIYENYGCLFKTLASLCGVLELKSELSHQTKLLYDKQDKDGLTQLIKTYYNVLPNRIKKFYNYFKLQWLSDNKPFGFEVHTIRINGLIARIEYCRDKLKAYVNCEIEEIEELSEERLDFLCSEKISNHHICNYSYAEAVSSCRLSW